MMMPRLGEAFAELVEQQRDVVPAVVVVVVVPVEHMSDWWLPQSERQTYIADTVAATFATSDSPESVAI